MRYKLLINFALTLAVTTFATVTAPAQITINIPKIGKIGKPKTQTDTKTQTSNPTTTTETVTTNNGRSSVNDSGSTNWWIDYQIGEINKYKKQLDEWDPVNQYFPSPQSNDDYIGLAFSKNERTKWLADKKVQPDPKLDAALDALKESLTRRLPEYKINPKSFNNRNAAEEKLVMQEMSDIPGLKVFKIGFNQPSWLIDKNEFGIPKARYKHGLIYGRNPKAEDPFCRVWYVNVIQDYAGAGTYGATYARYISKEYIACPAG